LNTHIGPEEMPVLKVTDELRKETQNKEDKPQVCRNFHREHTMMKRLAD